MPRVPGSYSHQGFNEPLPSVAASGCWVRRLAVARSRAQVIYLHGPGGLPAALAGVTPQAGPDSPPSPPAPAVSSAWLVEPSDSQGRRRDRPLGGYGDAMDAGRRRVRSRISVIPTGVDTERFCPSATWIVTRSVGLSGSSLASPWSSTPAGWTPPKGLHHLLQAVRQMERSCNLVVCGAGSDADFVRALHDESRGLTSPGSTDGST